MLSLVVEERECEARLSASREARALCGPCIEASKAHLFQLLGVTLVSRWLAYDCDKSAQDLVCSQPDERPSVIFVEIPFSQKYNICLPK